MLKMLNCHDATQMISVAMDDTAKSAQPWSLKLHLMMCSGCRRYANQTQLLRQTAKQFVKSGAIEPQKINANDDETK